MLLAVSAVGVLLVGVFPSRRERLVHAIGAVAHLVGGGLGLIALAYAVRPRSEIARDGARRCWAWSAPPRTVFFLTGVTQFLGVGGTERVAAYVIPVGLALAGDRALAPRRPGSAERRTAERQAARQEQAERARERDAALEAAARRGTRRRPPTTADDDELDDHWAPVQRRRD